MDEWEKYQNIYLEQTNRTDPPPPQAHTEHVNAVFTGSGKFDDSLKILKDPPPPVIVNNKIKKDQPIKTSKGGYHVVKTNEYPFRKYIPKIPFICVYVCCVRYVRFDNQSIERDRLIRIGFVLDFVKFISFTFNDKEMILVIEAVSR
ncbi:hypothetical protein Tco_0163419 [Tanacetum coccineum]